MKKVLQKIIFILVFILVFPIVFIINLFKNGKKHEIHVTETIGVREK